MATHTEPMGEGRRTFLPAAGHDWLLPFYDPFVKLLGGDRARRTLLAQASLGAGQHVLDVGCGTGTLVVLIKHLHPDVELVGLDPDPKALARARRKTQQAALDVHFDRGFADALPYPEASFDRVFSSFMFHHLAAEEKAATLREIRRVLAPGGALHLLDFGVPPSSGGGLARWFHSSEELRDNAPDRVLSLMRQAGFAAPAEVGRGAMLFGLLAYAYYRAPVGATAAEP